MEVLVLMWGIFIFGGYFLGRRRKKEKFSHRRPRMCKRLFEYEKLTVKSMHLQVLICFKINDIWKLNTTGSFFCWFVEILANYYNIFYFVSGSISGSYFTSRFSHRCSCKNAKRNRPCVPVITGWDWICLCDEIWGFLNTTSVQHCMNIKRNVISFNIIINILVKSTVGSRHIPLENKT